MWVYAVVIQSLHSISNSAALKSMFEVTTFLLHSIPHTQNFLHIPEHLLVPLPSPHREHLPPVTPESPHSSPPLPPSGAGTQPPALDPSVHSLKGMEDLGFSELRGYLLSLNPLDYHHVACVNKVEEEYWRLSEGYRWVITDNFFIPFVVLLEVEHALVPS